jgi:acetyl esterase/lipase
MKSEENCPGGASEEDYAAFGSVPWTRLDEPNTPISPTTIWHKAGVPYLRSGKACALQTLDIWIPASDPNTNTPNPQTLPSPEQGGNTWIIYLHGGAWRDPAITASSFTPAATNLLHRNKSSSPAVNPKIAGLISLNYRLSPHPSHPPSDPADPARQAAHPDHIADVLAGLAFVHRLLLLLRETGQKRKWILAGHSCGATLAFQAVMDPGRWGGLDLGMGVGVGVGVVKPDAVVGFNGLYDLAGFIRAPPEGYGHLREGYREFVEGAFGGDEKVWGAVCPATAEGRWVGEWVGEEGKKGVVVLVQSREDTLVPWRQVEVMQACLEREGRGRVDVRVLEAEGEHDEIWRDGRRMAEVLWEVVGDLE